MTNKSRESSAATVSHFVMFMLACLVPFACSDEGRPAEWVAVVGTPSATENDDVAAKKAEVEAGLRASAVKAMQWDASEAYTAIDEGRGSLFLPNPAQRLKATVDRAGVVVQADQQAAAFSLRTNAYGCAGSMRQVDERQPVSLKNRVAYSRPELAMEEWYLNGPLGLEQGFSLNQAADCAGPKVIAMEVLGDVAPVLEDADGDGRGDRVRFVDDAAGQTRFVYRDLAVVDAAGRNLPAWMTVEAGALAIHFDDAGATYPVEVDPIVVTQLAKLLPDEMGGGGERFGRSVAISSDGTKAIIGAMDEFAGFAAVYERIAGTWTYQQPLRSSDAALNDQFGYSVAIDGDTAIVGAFGDDDKGTESGAAYVFVKPPAGAWPTIETAKLTASDGASIQNFGRSLSISGNTVLIGAHRDDDKGASSGSAYIFVKPAGGWVNGQAFTAKLTASDGAANDYFGYSVAISGDTALIGAIQDDDKGSAYVFVKPAGGWVTTQAFTAKLTPSDGALFDYYGWSVSISGDTALVGALEDDDKGGNAGSAYVFVKPAGGWVTTQAFTAKLTASDGAGNDLFGSSVSISGDTALIGAYLDDDNTGDSGSAYVFVKPAGGWVTTSTFTAKLVNAAGAASDQMGYSVAIANTNVLVGARYRGISGVVLPYTRAGATWTQEPAFSTNKNAAYNDQAGTSVAISEDSLTAVVGAPNDDDNDIESGSAYVFVRPTTGDPWPTTHTAKLTASDGAANDNFGVSVSISGDAVVVGAHEDDDKGVDSGSAYVFVKPAGGWVTTEAYTAKLTASDGAAADFFGFSVSISGDTAIIGAYKDDAKGADSGSAYLFVKPAGGWETTQSFTAKLTPSDGASFDAFGFSVSISGDTAIIGAYSDGDKGLSSGSAYIFVKSAGSWATTDVFDAKLTASDGATSDVFGSSVSISGDTALVGAPNDDDKGVDSGSAYVFVKPAGGWATTQAFTAKLTPSDGAADDSFGFPVSISGDKALIGASVDDDKGLNAGSGYVFVKPASGWVTTQVFDAKLTANDGAADDRFGRSVATSSNTAIIGAPHNAGKGYQSGAAYVMAIGAVNGDACTNGVNCNSGFCVDGVCCQVAACMALDQCHDVGTCQAGTGQCSNPAKADGSSCADSDACNGAETCQAGACTAGMPVVCTAVDPCHDDGTCDPTSGMCDNPAKPDNSTCDDGNGCTQMDSCQAGACTGSKLVNCTALDQCHDVGTCDPATGMCDNPPKADESTCDEGMCLAGVCTAPEMNPPTPTDVFSCQCSMPGTSSSTPTSAVAVLALAVLSLRRRRGNRAA